MAILSNGKLYGFLGSVKETGQRLESEVKKRGGRFHVQVHWTWMETLGVHDW